MPVEPFFDTNILLYSITPDDPRSPRALQLLGEGGFISIQVLNEFVNVARRKMKLDWTRIETSLGDFDVLLNPPVELTHAQHKAAVAISRVYGFSIYDSTIVASAIDAGCGALYTEDLQHGQLVAGVRIINPFL